MRQILLLILATLLPGLAAAQDEPGVFQSGGDVYVGGEAAGYAAPVAGDLFVAGQDAATSAAVAGTAHMIGQTIRVSQPIGQNLYAAGQTIDVTAKVDGNVTAVGQTVTVADVGRNVRAAGQTVTLNGAVAGSAVASGQTVALNGVVAGDLAISAAAVRFGPGATVAGTLTLYSDKPEAIEVPASVAPAERIQRKTVSDWQAEAPSAMPVSRRTIWRGLLTSIVTVTVLAAILAALMPEGLARIRSTLTGSPARSLWFGFLTLSAAIGAVVVLAMTIIGLLGVPVAIALAVLGGFLGYIVGAYALGVWLLSLIGRDAPAQWIERAGSAAVGAVVIALIGLIPFVGWLAVLALTLAGLGAMCITWFRPAFFAS